MLPGVPQGRILGPLLYTLYTADIPKAKSTTLSTFADDTAILSCHTNPITATANLQTHLRSIENWTRKWRLKINKAKFTHVTFTLRRGNSPQLYINYNTIPQADSIRQLGFHLDKRLTWKRHIAATRKHLALKTRELYWIRGKHSALSLTNRVLIYKAILKPVWTYGTELSAELPQLTDQSFKDINQNSYVP